MLQKQGLSLSESKNGFWLIKLDGKSLARFKHQDLAIEVFQMLQSREKLMWARNDSLNKPHAQLDLFK